MGHKGEILFPPPLHVQRALGRIGLQGQADGMIENAVDNVKWLPLQVQPVVVGKIVDAAAKDVILSNDLFDFKVVLQTL